MIDTDASPAVRAQGNGKTGIAHVLYSLRAEGCPRLALSLLAEDFSQTGTRGSVITAVDESLDLAKEFEDLHASVTNLGWKRRAFVRAGRECRKILIQLKPSGIICYTVGLHVPVAAAARSLGIPTVLHLGCAPPARRIPRLKIRLQMLAGLPFVTRYAACSAFVRRDSIRAYGLPGRLVVTVPNGIRLSEFTALRNMPRQSSEGAPFVVGMVGNLGEHKDQATLIDALGILVRREANVRLRLIGAGPREPWLRDRAYHVGVSDHVTFTGMVTDIKTELTRLDLFAYSVREEEGLGIALVEALAAGVPIVASDVAACREVLDDGRYGRLVAPRDAAAWAAAMSAGAKLTPAPVEAAARYDIRQTARAYRALLGPAA